MTSKREYTGINIQHPISQLILDGKKTIETRTYPIPKQYIGQDLAIIETPGTKGNFRARIVGLIRFDDSFQYKDKKSFYADVRKHCVTPDSPWKWTSQKPKWGWPIAKIQVFSKARPGPEKKGIVFTRSIIL